METKWIDESGIFYPINGEIVLHSTPGEGIWQVYKSPNPQDGRIGLKKIFDSKFTFDFKIYELGCERMIERIKKVWNSEEFMEDNKNLGIIFNGTKGTGKTISAKILCNELDMPVIIVDKTFNGAILPFIQSLNFECVIFLDEAEKSFKDDESEILLKLIDGVFNVSRKLYILTTNTLTVNENLINRPGRIRYIQQFGNLTEKAVNDFVDDNLKDKSLKEKVIQTVDLLEFSTIDILKNIVEEVNIMGPDYIGEESPLNIPRAKYVIDVLKFVGLNKSHIPQIKKIIDENYTDKTKSLFEWVRGVHKDKDGEEEYNEDLFTAQISECNYCCTEKITSQYSNLWKGSTTNYGTIIEEPDEDGFFLVSGRYGYGDEELMLVINQRNSPSLYRGKLGLIY